MSSLVTPTQNQQFKYQDSRRGSLNPTTIAPPDLTHVAFIPQPLPSRKEKRKASNSPVLPYSMNPISTTPSFQPIIRKRRLLLNPEQSNGTVFATNLSLCTRCHQYQIPVC